MVISKKTIIFQGFRGGGGSNIFRGWGSKCYTFLKKPIKYVIFQGAPEPLFHLWTRECILLPLILDWAPVIGENALRPSGC